MNISITKNFPALHYSLSPFSHLAPIFSKPKETLNNSSPQLPTPTAINYTHKRGDENKYVVSRSLALLVKQVMLRKEGIGK